MLGPLKRHLGLAHREEVGSAHIDDAWPTLTMDGPNLQFGAVPGPDSPNRHLSGPVMKPGSVPGLGHVKWAVCKRGMHREFHLALD